MLRVICQSATKTSVTISWEPNTVDLGESNIAVAKLGLVFFSFQQEYRGLCSTMGWFGQLLTSAGILLGLTVAPFAGCKSNFIIVMLC